MVILLLCSVCNGKGMLRNPYFEYCADPIRREAECEIERAGDCKHCKVKKECSGGEYVRCYNCEGRPLRVLKNWEVVSEEEYRLFEPSECFGAFVPESEACESCEYSEECYARMLERI